MVRDTMSCDAKTQISLSCVGSVCSAGHEEVCGANNLREQLST